MLSIAHSRLPSRKCSVDSYSMIEVSSSWTSLPFVRQLCVSSCARPLTLPINFYITAPASLWPCGIDSGGRQPRPIRNISSQKKTIRTLHHPFREAFGYPIWLFIGSWVHSVDTVSSDDLTALWADPWNRISVLVYVVQWRVSGKQTKNTNNAYKASRS